MGDRPRLVFVIKKLSLGEIVELLGSTPEQPVFDWKRTFAPPRDENSKGEFVKDLMAVANGTAFTRSSGFVLYGVNPDAKDPFVGVSERWDDNEAQALVRGALDPMPEFLYYEVPAEDDLWIGVVHVVPRGGLFVVTRDLGKLREGQSMIRQGSTTRGIRREDQIRLYLTPGYGFADQLLQRYGAAAAFTNAQAAWLHQLNQTEQQLIRQMYASVGLPPPY
jgi:hypothetical protein